MDCIVVEQMITPYINHELSDKDMAKFLEHIKTCKDCYEELEIYFAIHFALLQLEDNPQAPIHIKNMLEADIKSSERYLANKRNKKIVVTTIVAIAQIAVLLTLLTQLEIWSLGTLEATTMYRIHNGNFFTPQGHNNIIEEVDQSDQVEPIEEITIQATPLLEMEETKMVIETVEVKEE